MNRIIFEKLKNRTQMRPGMFNRFLNICKVFVLLGFSSPFRILPTPDRHPWEIQFR